jgi:aspartate oxidase
MIAFGSDETNVFHTQSQMLADYWANGGVTATVLNLQDTNHYTIVDNLIAGQPGSVGAFLDEHLCGYRR